MGRRFQFRLTTLMLLAPTFAIGYLVGQKTAEESLKADRARVVKKDLELRQKEDHIRLMDLMKHFRCGTP